jgi:hypothetical protein
MTAFVKSFRHADRVRRYTIQSTNDGWNVRKEEDDRVLEQSCYHDWHRVERAQRAFAVEFTTLLEKGWREE